MDRAHPRIEPPQNRRQRRARRDRSAGRAHRGRRPGLFGRGRTRGPRNRVHKGIAVLSQRTGAAVVNLVAVPSRRWIFTRAWDRFQIPKPFTTIHGYFGEPIFPRKDESVDQYRKRIETSLNDLEREHDPIESQLATAATLRRQTPG